MSALLGLFFPHQATTHGITVRVAVTYLADQSEPAKGRWFWAYHIRIENGGGSPVQLIGRRWIIVDGRGKRHRVEGEGVVGAQPILGPGEAYDYVSGCPLDTPSGSMSGSYQMVDADGGGFDIRIPRFQLVSPAVSA